MKKKLLVGLLLVILFAVPVAKADLTSKQKEKLATLKTILEKLENTSALLKDDPTIIEEIEDTKSHIDAIEAIDKKELTQESCIKFLEEKQKEYDEKIDTIFQEMADPKMSTENVREKLNTARLEFEKETKKCTYALQNF